MMTLVVEVEEGWLQGVASLLLFGRVVGEGRPVLDIAEPRDHAGAMEQAFAEGGLSRAGVPAEAEHADRLGARRVADDVGGR